MVTGFWCFSVFLNFSWVLSSQMFQLPWHWTQVDPSIIGSGCHPSPGLINATWSHHQDWQHIDPVQDILPLISLRIFELQVYGVVPMPVHITPQEYQDHKVNIPTTIQHQEPKVNTFKPSTRTKQNHQKPRHSGSLHNISRRKPAGRRISKMALWDGWLHMRWFITITNWTSRSGRGSRTAWYAHQYRKKSAMVPQMFKNQIVTYLMFPLPLSMTTSKDCQETRVWHSGQPLGADDLDHHLQVCNLNKRWEQHD